MLGNQARRCPQIVVLDGYTLNPGDLSWDALHEVGPCEIYDRTLPHEVLARAADAQCLLTNKVVLDASMIKQLPKLKYIGVLATGTNVVDIQAAQKHGIAVTNIPAYGTMSVAQTVFAHLLHLTHDVAHHSESVTQGNWSMSKDFCYWLTPLIELDTLTMGIVGYGQIGQAVARMARAFGMDVLVHSRTKPKQLLDAQWVSLDQLLETSDVVSLHCPLTPVTEHLLNAQKLALMKPTAFLINTSRGALVDEFALATALREKRLAGAGVDTLSSEPPSPDNPLINEPACHITPHLAWATQAARKRLLQTAAQNLVAYLSGKPINLNSA